MTLTANSLITAIRDDLISAGIVRHPNAVGTLPPLHAEPPEPPGPGSRADDNDPDATRETAGDLVISVRLGPEIIGPPGASWRTWPVEFIFRSVTTQGLKRARVIESTIHERYVRASDNGEAVTLAAGGATQLQAIQVQTYSGLAYVDLTDSTRTDRASFAFTVLL